MIKKKFKFCKVNSMKWPRKNNSDLMNRFIPKFHRKTNKFKKI